VNQPFKQINLEGSEDNLDQYTSTLTTETLTWNLLRRSEHFTTVTIQVVVFWVVTPSSDVVGYRRFGELYFSPEVGSTKGLRSVGILPHQYTSSLFRGPW